MTAGDCARCGETVGDAHLRTVTASESAWTCEARCVYCRQGIYLHHWQQGPAQWIHFVTERAECPVTVATPEANRG